MLIEFPRGCGMSICLSAHMLAIKTDVASTSCYLRKRMMTKIAASTAAPPAHILFLSLEKNLLVQ